MQYYYMTSNNLEEAVLSPVYEEELISTKILRESQKPLQTLIQEKNKSLFNALQIKR